MPRFVGHSYASRHPIFDDGPVGRLPREEPQWGQFEDAEVPKEEPLVKARPSDDRATYHGNSSLAAIHHPLAGV